MIDTDELRPRVEPGKVRAAVVLAVLALASTLSFAGALWWGLDLLSHFHAIYFWVALVTAVVLVTRRWWRLAAWAGVLVGLEALLLVPLYSSCFGGEEPAAAAPRLRAVAYNMLHGNPRAPAAAAHIAALEPDVVALLELTPGQVQEFAAAFPGWTQLTRPREDAFGIGIFTRRPPQSVEVLELGPGSMPSIEARVEVDGRVVTILAVHLPPPIGARRTETRDRMLRAISSWAAEQEGPVLVLGDLNATPWSAVMREILGAGPLRSTQRFGLQGTWPSLLGPLGIPIDHALVAGPIEPVARTIEPAFGSDHRMLFVELELR